MALSMYDASVPVFIRTLGIFSNILDKGAAYADSRKIDPSVLINSRLAPDMRPLSSQVQLASDMALRGGARLAGVEFPSNPDTETTFPELKERLAKTIRFLETLPADKIDGSEERAIVLQMRDGELAFTGQSYLLNFVLPNVYFHVATAYLILRHNGVELGKKDFLGAA